jgi:hypothetical protein
MLSISYAIPMKLKPEIFTILGFNFYKISLLN